MAWNADRIEDARGLQELLDFRDDNGGVGADLKQVPIDATRSRFCSLTAADLKVRACAGAPEGRRAAVAASSDSRQT